MIHVNRRTGGLEIQTEVSVKTKEVNRRTGGLEKYGTPKFFKATVNRRIGGNKSRLDKKTSREDRTVPSVSIKRIMLSRDSLQNL